MGTAAINEAAGYEAWGDAPVLVVCEHAARDIPADWGDLGIGAEVAASHAAWDIGALPLARRIAAGLGGALIHGRLSRLLYDLNRPPEAPDAVPRRSEIHDIPGNALSGAARAERVARIYRPWCAALDAALDGGSDGGLDGALDGVGEMRRPEAVVTVHSFTPVWFGVPRATRIGVLHGADARLADRLLARGAGWERNAPYGPGDGVLHTVERVGARRGIAAVMIEVRNDLLADDAGVAAIAAELLGPLRGALADLGADLGAAGLASADLGAADLASTDLTSTEAGS